jgi:hypothetical protein
MRGNKSPGAWELFLHVRVNIRDLFTDTEHRRILRIKAKKEEGFIERLNASETRENLCSESVHEIS